MSWTPAQPNYAGIKAFHLAAVRIVEDNQRAALDWAGEAPNRLESFKRLQYAQRHSRLYPLLVVQPAQADYPWQQQALAQVFTFGVMAFITGSDVDQLTLDAEDYLAALIALWLSAPRAAWVQFAPQQGSLVHEAIPEIRNVVFGELLESKEQSGLYLRSFALRLIINAREVFA